MADPPEFAVWSFESFDSAQKVVLDLGMHTSYKGLDSIVMALYCPFWMLNKTGLMLSYRVCVCIVSSLLITLPLHTVCNWLLSLHLSKNLENPLRFSSLNRILQRAPFASAIHCRILYWYAFFLYQIILLY